MSAIWADGRYATDSLPLPATACRCLPLTFCQVWMENTPPPGEFASCKVCAGPMPLLLELNGDLPEHFPGHRRRLYVFACPRRPCMRKDGCVRVLRATQTDNSQTVKDSSQTKTADRQTAKRDCSQTTDKDTRGDLGAALFGVPSFAAANPFSVAAVTDSLDKVRLAAPVATTATPVAAPAAAAAAAWPDRSAFARTYPHLYLDAEYETISRPPSPDVPPVTVEMPDADADADDGTAADKTFESELDTAFVRFSTRLAHNPEQVLRYDFRGLPLLCSYVDAVGRTFAGAAASAAGGGAATATKIPPCQRCGGERVFELQLVPHAISVLEGAGEVDTGMEWATIIVCVCARDCGGGADGAVVWAEEWAGVQWE